MSKTQSRLHGKSRQPALVARRPLLSADRATPRTHDRRGSFLAEALAADGVTLTPEESSDLARALLRLAELGGLVAADTRMTPTSRNGVRQ